MGILTKEDINKAFLAGKLISNPRKNDKGEFDIESASYDLAAGIAVVKHDGVKVFSKRAKKYKYVPGSLQQDTVTLKPGQMMFVITSEEVHTTDEVSATVYSRNSLAYKGVLALNAGHIDPGYHGPISIKLINLRNSDFTLRLGEPIFTIVFSQLQSKIKNLEERRITSDDMLTRVLTATDLSLDNALYDLALLNNFVKKDDFGKEYLKWLKSSVWGIISSVLALIGTVVMLNNLYKIAHVPDLIKQIFNIK